MLGKEKCRILKEIRQRIADENEIPYVTRECRHQGDCRGTCPRCESELRQLEQALEARRSAGKRITVAALCSGLILAGAGCTRSILPGGEPTDIAGMIEEITPEPTEEVTTLQGEIAYPEESEKPEETELEGYIASTEDPTGENGDG